MTFVARRTCRLTCSASSGQREEVVDRAVEEALDLRGVQVDGHDPVGARGLEHVRDQPRGDRLAALCFLSCRAYGQNGMTTVIRLADARFSASTMISCSMTHWLIGAEWLWMHERVAAAHRLLEPHEDLAVGEVVRRLRGDASRRGAWRPPRPARGAPARRRTSGSSSASPDLAFTDRPPRRCVRRRARRVGGRRAGPLAAPPSPRCCAGARPTRRARPAARPLAAPRPPRCTRRRRR